MGTSHEKPLSNLETAAFCSQMAMILKSGISSLEGISILLEDAPSAEEKALLSTMNEAIQAGSSFSHALQKTGVYPSYMLQMTEIGEETGTLDEVMESLSDHYTREEAVAKSIRSALTYPSIMIGMMMLVIIVLITKVMPIFNQVFKQLGREMTGFSKGILAVGTTLSRYSSVFIIVVIAIILLLLYLFKTKSGKNNLLKLAYHLKMTQNIYDKMAACRFAGAMSLALRSGMTPERGLDFSEALIENSFFLQKIHTCKELLADGAELAEAFQKSRIFTGVYARMAAIANKAGTMDEVMSRIAGQYEEEIDEQTTRIISALEPTIVIILSVIVGVILLSVMLPLLGIMSGL